MSLEMLAQACKVSPEQADKTKKIANLLATKIAEILKEEDADYIMMSLALADAVSMIEAGMVAAISKDGGYPRPAVRDRVENLYDCMFKFLRQEASWRDQAKGEA